MAPTDERHTEELNGLATLARTLQVTACKDLESEVLGSSRAGHGGIS
jgi:hypothetical protein